jgi:hypothetical protein
MEKHSGLSPFNISSKKFDIALSNSRIDSALIPFSLMVQLNRHSSSLTNSTTVLLGINAVYLVVTCKPTAIVL